MSTLISRGPCRLAAVFAVTLACVFAGETAAKPKPAVVAKKLPATMLPMHVADVVVAQDPVTGEVGLVALLQVGDQPPVPVPISVSGLPGEAAAGDVGIAQAPCDVLDLQLGPIELDLLGLNVVTSEICVRITGEEGGLLGELVCLVAGLLDDGGLLGDILGGLTDAELNTLLDGLTDILNGVLTRATAPSAVVGVSDSSGTAGIIGQQAPGECDILNLSLGPIDLNLLGLDVEVDDCDEGPVTIDVFAEAGPGNLLGNLLCNLANLLDTPASDVAIANALNRVADAILDLVEVL